MLSTFPTTCSTDSFLGTPFPTFEPCFPAVTEPDAFFTTNYGSQPNLIDPEQANSKPTLTSGSDETSRSDERKRRRKQSNRESAKRSRMRKQRHLENLRNLATRLKSANRDLSNRLGFLLLQNHSFSSENLSLRSEAAFFRRRLNDIRQMLLDRHAHQNLTWPCINNAVMTPSLTTATHYYCTNIYQ